MQWITAQWSDIDVKGEDKMFHFRVLKMHGVKMF